jgi:hypothetical protein
MPSVVSLPERRFAELTARRIRRGTFTGVDELIDAIDLWAEAGNLDPSPSSGMPPPRRSSKRSPEDEPPPPDQIRDAAPSLAETGEHGRKHE